MFLTTDWFFFHSVHGFPGFRTPFDCYLLSLYTLSLGSHDHFLLSAEYSLSCNVWFRLLPALTCRLYEDKNYSFIFTVVGPGAMHSTQWFLKKKFVQQIKTLCNIYHLVTVCYFDCFTQKGKKDITKLNFPSPFSKVLHSFYKMIRTVYFYSHLWFLWYWMFSLAVYW